MLLVIWIYCWFVFPGCLFRVLLEVVCWLSDFEFCCVVLIVSLLYYVFDFVFVSVWKVFAGLFWCLIACTWVVIDLVVLYWMLRDCVYLLCCVCGFG